MLQLYGFAIQFCETPCLQMGMELKNMVMVHQKNICSLFVHVPIFLHSLLTQIRYDQYVSFEIIFHSF